MSADRETVGRGTVLAVSRNDEHTFTKPNRDEIVLIAGIGIEGDTHSGVHVRHRSRVAADPSQPNLRQVHLIHAELFDEVAGKGYTVPAGALGENVTTSGIDLLGLPRGTILRFGPAAATASVPSPADAGAGNAGAGGDAASPEQAAGDAGAARSRAGASQTRELGEGSPVAAVLAAADAATLDEATARAAVAVAAAVERDAARSEADPRPAVVVAGLRNPCRQINRYQDGLLNEVVGRDQDGNVVRKAGVMGVVLRGGTVRPGDPVVIDLPPGPSGPLERV